MMKVSSHEGIIHKYQSTNTLCKQNRHIPAHTSSLLGQTSWITCNNNENDNTNEILLEWFDMARSAFHQRHDVLNSIVSVGIYR